MELLYIIPWKAVVHAVYIFITFYFITLAFHAKETFVKVLFHILWIGSCYLLFTHQLPWVKNKLIYDAIRISNDAVPYTMYLNYDKPFIGLLVFWMLGFGPGRFKRGKVFLVTFGATLAACVSLFYLATHFDYIAYSPKIPKESLIWASHNFFLVVIAEEAFFRRYVQGGIQQLFGPSVMSKVTALIVGSLTFGIAHYSGGQDYVILAAVAGLFYGGAYMITQRLEAAIMTHFLVNCVHFFLFTYPAKYTF